MSKKKKRSEVMRVLKYFRKISTSQKRLLFLVVLWRIWAALVALTLPIYYSQIVDIITSSSWIEKSIVVTSLLSVLFVILLLEIWSIASWRILWFSIIPMEIWNMKKIFTECFEYLHKHSYRFFANNFSWSLVKRLNKLAYSYENIADIFIFDIIILVISFPFIIIVIFSKNRVIWVIFSIFTLAYGVLQYVFYKMNIPYEIESNKHDSKITWELADTITNNFNILTFTSLKREIHRFTSTLDARWKISKKTYTRSEWIRFSSDIMLVSFEILVIYFSIKLRWQSLISAWTIVLIQAYVFKVFDQMFTLWYLFKRLNRSVWESIEMLDILDEKHEIVDITDNKLEVHSWKIELKNVDFAYNEWNKIFEWLNLKIKQWERVALVWHSGSWKTTITKLLLRLFDIQWWEILIDDQNIAQVTQDSLRSNISMVPQDPILFHRSLKENMAYANPWASEEEIIAASKMARCHDFISWLKDGYDTLVWERWIKLSGWERQRVAIARIILENKRILVLDEATSSLDSQSEQLIQAALDIAMKNKTVIVVAHRLSTIMKMDRIVVMDNGNIIEHWSHKELLAKDNGIYKKLRDIQSGWFIE